MAISIEFAEADAAALCNELAEFEARYGVPSDRRDDAFTVDGRFVETPEWARWDLVVLKHRRACRCNA
jgi:hypothetical protein